MEPGETAPDFELRDQDGETVRLSDLRGRPVVLYFYPLRKFADKHGLEFTLLSDGDHAVAEAYGVWVEKSMYGRRYWGNERTTFVIDPDGTVAAVLRKVKPAEHDERVLAELAG